MALASRGRPGAVGRASCAAWRDPQSMRLAPSGQANRRATRRESGAVRATAPSGRALDRQEPHAAESAIMRVRDSIKTWHVGFGLVLSLSLFVPLGCSLSESSRSSSDSSESSSDSYKSSSGGEKSAAYRDDIRDYTAAYVKSGGQVADF